ncbi:hypothetical protein P7K49_036444 [Saguinus oedipus]|uniref:Uncharacterized protein n=1 Tax=Saguinus oedipus TaxID=9490 RepID=A0ABQ9TK43_SAGOE|nr:hypothetical protein P7K49_036444 [Saguinus oedipus]
MVDRPVHDEGHCRGRPGEGTGTVLLRDLAHPLPEPGPQCPHPPTPWGTGPAGPRGASSKNTPSSGLRVPPWRCPLHVRILVVSWQQALQDKGCKSQSQGKKEEKLQERQAPAPRQAREAREAGGTMNVENTGKAGVPTDLALPGEAGAGGRLLCGCCYPRALSSHSPAGGGPDRLQRPASPVFRDSGVYRTFISPPASHRVRGPTQ